MKKLLSISALLLSSVLCYTQYTITDLVPVVTNNNAQCALDVNMTFSLGTSNPGTIGTIHQYVVGNGPSGSSFYASINWGDGSTNFNTSGTAVNSSGALTMNPAATHTYTSPGSYSIITTLISNTNQSYAIDTVQVNVGVCPTTLYPYVAVDCNNDGTPESNISQGVPILLTSANGMIYSGVSVNNSVFFPALSPGSYTMTIDPSWLAQNGYTLTTISSGNLVLIPGTTTVAFVLGCTTVVGYNITDISPNQSFSYACDATVTMAFSAQTPLNPTPNFDFYQTILGTNFNGFQGSLAINWGDGTTSSHSGGTSTTGSMITWRPSVSHTYATPGNYTIITNVFNSANQTSGSDTVTYAYTGCSTSVYNVVQLDCNADGVVESYLNTVIPFTLSDGNTTYSPVNTTTGMSQFSDLPAGTYNINIDANWLLNSGYTIGSIVPSGQLITTGVGAYTISITLNCVGNTTTLCTNGMVYCDSNSNGIYDQGEYLLPNAPVFLYNASAGSVITTNTSTQGYYFQSFQGTPGDTIIATLSQAWLTAMGYTLSQPNGVQFGAGMCNSGANNNVNIGVNCNGFQFPTLCYSGIVFCDANNNGIYDNNESLLAGAPVTIFGSTTTSNAVTVYSTPNGYFSYCGSLPNVTSVAFASISSTWLTENGYSTTNGTTVFSIPGSNTGSTSTIYIPINCTNQPSCADLWTTVTPWIGYYQGTNAYVRVNWGNYGPGASNYTLSLTWPAGVTLVTSSIQNPGYTIAGNTITWNFSSTTSFFSLNDVLIFQVPTGLASGTMHYFTSTIAPTGTASDCYTGNNSGTLLQIVGNSYDPNMKTVERSAVYTTMGDYSNEPTWLDWTMVDELVYTVQFQNTGTAPAQNVVVIDTLSTNLDWSTFELVESTHAVNVVNLGNGVFRFEFNQIWLPDSTSDQENSHGHFVYRIRENENNALYSEILNTAYIFFDWNEEIVTNTTLNINEWIDWVAESNSLNVLAYPNPSTTQITVQVPGKFLYEIYDAVGKKLDSGFAVNQAEINVSDLTNGLYELVIYQGENRQVGRFEKR